MLLSSILGYLLLLALSPFAPLTSASQCTNPPLSVQTTNGLVTGHVAPNTTCVLEFLGIPYARPPVGNLRFAAPRKLAGKKKKAYEAAEFGYDCPLSPSPPVDYPDLTPQAGRIVSYFASGAGTPQSEDCLTLNIWSRPREGAKPVLVFFYGGRFTIGNTNTPFYNGKHLASAEDVLVVTLNYRTNIFGFPGSGAGQPQNLGLRDQRAAVEWIHENIRAFGGDPDRIILSGQSSGGVSVDYWAYAYRKDPIAAGLIAHSGNAFSFPLNPEDVTERNWKTVVESVNCTNAEDVMACMRSVDWESIKAAAASIRPTPSSSVLRSTPPFYPTPDNHLVFADYTPLTTAGSFAPLPVLMGTTTNEAGYYVLPAYRNGIVPTPDQIAAFHLESFTCPVHHQAAQRRRHGVPAWTYRFAADWPNTRLYPDSGAYHGTDLHMVFGASGDVSGIPPDPDQEALTRVVQRAWVDFCYNPSKGLERLGWRQFERGEKTVMVFGEGNEPVARAVRPDEYDVECENTTMAGLGTG